MANRFPDVLRRFSKDVENAATGGDKDRIDAHKLKRLHMILQPFMLRRVKVRVRLLAACVRFACGC